MFAPTETKRKEKSDWLIKLAHAHAHIPDWWCGGGPSMQQRWGEGE